MRCEYLRECSKTFKTTLMVYSGAWGKLVHEKNQKSKISRHCHFKPGIMLNLCMHFTRKNTYQIDVRFGSNQNFNSLQLRIRGEYRQKTYIYSMSATAAFWVRIQTSPKIQNGRHKQRRGQHTLARQKDFF